MASQRGTGSRRRIALAAMLVATALAGCSSTGTLSSKFFPNEPPKQAEMSPATLREHQRILAA